jgi:hypothetical protein
MSFFPESGRLVGHALLDSVVAYVPGGDVEVSGASANLALGAINEIDGAVLATADDDDNVSIDISGLVGGAVITIAQLVNELADARGVDRETVIAGMRSYLDG